MVCWCLGGMFFTLFSLHFAALVLILVFNFIGGLAFKTFVCCLFLSFLSDIVCQFAPFVGCLIGV